MESEVCTSLQLQNKITYVGSESLSLPGAIGGQQPPNDDDFKLSETMRNSLQGEGSHEEMKGSIRQSKASIAPSEAEQQRLLCSFLTQRTYGSQAPLPTSKPAGIPILSLAAQLQSSG